jgi:hypothetical protein
MRWLSPLGGLQGHDPHERAPPNPGSVRDESVAGADDGRVQARPGGHQAVGAASALSEVRLTQGGGTPLSDLSLPPRRRRELAPTWSQAGRTFAQLTWQGFRGARGRG